MQEGPDGRTGELASVDNAPRVFPLVVCSLKMLHTGNLLRAVASPANPVGRLATEGLCSHKTPSCIDSKLYRWNVWM